MNSFCGLLVYYTLTDGHPVFKYKPVTDPGSRTLSTQADAQARAEALMETLKDSTVFIILISLSHWIYFL